MTRNNVPRIIRRCKTNWSNTQYLQHLLHFRFPPFVRVSNTKQEYFKCERVRKRGRLSNWISNRQQLHENANDLLCYSRQMCILLGILSLNPIANEPFNLSGLYSSRCVVYYIYLLVFFSYIRWFDGWLVSFCRTTLHSEQRVSHQMQKVNAKKLRWIRNCIGCMLYLFILLFINFKRNDMMRWCEHTRINVNVDMICE